jgi:hypothetical protein
MLDETLKHSAAIEEMTRDVSALGWEAALQQQGRIC